MIKELSFVSMMNVKNVVDVDFFAINQRPKFEPKRSLRLHKASQVLPLVN